MSKLIQKVKESIKAKYKKLKETILFRFSKQKGNPMDLEDESREEGTDSQKKREWLSIFPPRVQKWVIIVGAAVVIAKAKPALGPAPVKNVPSFERLVAVKPVEGFSPLKTPSRRTTSLDANKPKVDFRNPNAGSFSEFQKTNLVDPVIQEEKKKAAIQRRAENRKLNRLLTEMEKSHKLSFEKLENEGKTIKTLINSRNPYNIVIKRPDLDENIFGSRAQLTNKLKHFIEVGLKPDADYNQAFVEELIEENRDARWYYQKFEKTMGQAYTTFTVNIVGDTNNYAIRVEFGAGRHKNEPEKIENAIVFLDSETLEIVLCRENPEKPQEYILTSCYSPNDKQLYWLLKYKKFQ